MKTIEILNGKDEVVATLEIEGATASDRETVSHYAKFANLFMRHLGRNLWARIAA